jgi:hypothetical protein
VTIPEGLIPLVDGDIIRYEIGYAAEAGWRARTHTEDVPPFSYVRELLEQRLADICSACRTTETPRLFFTTGRTFRFDIAKKKPYKGTRIEKKPFHFDNLTVYLRDILGAEEVTGIEADDKLAIEHTASNGQTILVSRDKDLKQVPGWFYSWELNLQPSWGPALITKEGSLKFIPADSERKRPAKLTGTGLAWAYAQMLIGDPTDNIGGLPGCGPVEAHRRLTAGSEGGQATTPAGMLEAVQQAYREHYGPTWETELLEQGRLVWLCRRFNEDGSPQLWEIGLDE